VGSDGRVKRLVSTGRERVRLDAGGRRGETPRVRSVDATLSAYERDRDRAGFLLAGALAYRLFRWCSPSKKAAGRQSPHRGDAPWAAEGNPAYQPLAAV